MASETESRERVTGIEQASIATGGRMAKTLQATDGTQPIGEYAELETSGAVQQTGGWIRGGHDWKDVRCQREFIAWRRGWW